MLVVFDKSVSNPPRELEIYSGWYVPANRKEVADHYRNSFPDAVMYNFPNGNFMGFTHANEDPLYPRSMVVVDDIFCIFIGNLENIVDLRRHYGLNRQTTEVMLIVEIYKVIRDRAPYPPHQAIKDIKGKFGFVLFDAKTSTLFAAKDPVFEPWFLWGLLNDGSLAFSDDCEVIMDVCGRSGNHFPLGCIYQNTFGLVNFEFPLHTMIPVVNRDERGEPSSTYFVMDDYIRRPGLRRIGSAVDWTDATTVSTGRWSFLWSD